MVQIISKKALVISLILILTVAILGTLFGLAEKKEKKEVEPPILKASDETDVSNWETYRNEELGFEFKHPNNCGVIINDKIELFDTGKKTVISLNGDECNDEIIFTFTSEDYSKGVGEGCCLYYPGASINTELPMNEIDALIRAFRPMQIEKIKIDDKNAIHFYGLKGYIDINLIDYVLLPYSRNGFVNLLIESPALFTSQYKEGMTSQNQEQEIIEVFKNKGYLQNYDHVFSAVVKSLKFINKK